MIKYTVCFIKHKDKLLMLNRQRHPNMGLWNGVGGKIEANETPTESVLREVYEETGIKLKKVNFAGIVTWESTSENSGMYVFTEDWQEGCNYKTPKSSEEGILDWKDIDWILDSKNLGVVSNIPIFLPKMLRESTGYKYSFIYKDNILSTYTVTEIDLNFDMKEKTVEYHCHVDNAESFFGTIVTLFKNSMLKLLSFLNEI